MLVIPRYAVTACETDHYILVVFVVMSKEEGSMYMERLHIPMILGRMGTSQASVETFQHIPMTVTGKTDRKALREEAENLFMARLKKSADHCTEHNTGLTTAVLETLRMLCEKILGVPLKVCVTTLDGSSLVVTLYLP